MDVGAPAAECAEVLEQFVQGVGVIGSVRHYVVGIGQHLSSTSSGAIATGSLRQVEQGDVLGVGGKVAGRVGFAAAGCDVALGVASGAVVLTRGRIHVEVGNHAIVYARNITTRKTAHL